MWAQKGMKHNSPCIYSWNSTSVMWRINISCSSTLPNSKWVDLFEFPTPTTHGLYLLQPVCANVALMGKWWSRTPDLFLAFLLSDRSQNEAATWLSRSSRPKTEYIKPRINLTWAEAMWLEQKQTGFCWLSGPLRALPIWSSKIHEKVGGKNGR